MNPGVEVLGGIALILFGIRFLRKGLDRLFGGQLIRWLSRLTSRPWKAFGAGVAAGAVSPSSTSISIMAVQLLGDGRLRPEGILAMLLGANVGMTILVQFMSVRIQDYAGLLIAFGVAAFVYAQRELLRGSGQCLLALGFIFLAIQMIGAGAADIAKSEDARQTFLLLHGHPGLIFAGTAVLAVILQSSTATIGLGVGLCASGLLGAGELVSWVLGTNVGVGLSSVIVGWRSLDARRLGMANLITKLCLALPLLFSPGLAGWIFEALPGEAAQQIILYHTLFNLAVGLLALPFLTPVIRLASLVIAQPEPENARVVSHLEPKALDTPSVALARATRETLRMADQVRAQLESFWRACKAGDVELARRIQKDDDAVDRHNREILAYLSRITGEKSPRDNRWQLALMNFAVELEAVGDLLEKHLCDLILKQREEVAGLSADDLRDLESVYLRVLERFDRAMSLLASHDSKDAALFASEKRAFNEACRKLQQIHYERLRSGDRASVAGNTYFIDYLGGLRRIHSHVMNLAYVMIDPAEKHGASP